MAPRGSLSALAGVGTLQHAMTLQDTRAGLCGFISLLVTYAFPLFTEFERNKTAFLLNILQHRSVKKWMGFLVYVNEADHELL